MMQQNLSKADRRHFSCSNRSFYKHQYLRVTLHVYQISEALKLELGTITFSFQLNESQMHFMSNNAIFQTTAISFPEAEMWLVFAEIQLTIQSILSILFYNLMHIR